jgi:hypothetical protein
MNTNQHKYLILINTNMEVTIKYQVLFSVLNFVLFFTQN